MGEQHGEQLSQIPKGGGFEVSNMRLAHIFATLKSAFYGGLVFQHKLKEATMVTASPKWSVTFQATMVAKSMILKLPWS